MHSRSGLDTGEGEVSSLDGIKPRFSGHPARNHYTDLATVLLLTK